MKYCITYDDLFGHIGVIDEFTSLEEAQQVFKSNCYTPAQIYDDFICLDKYDEDDYVDTLDDYQFTRLDRDNE